MLTQCCQRETANFSSGGRKGGGAEEGSNEQSQ